jgi:pentatricopeptide repeat protein
VSLARPPRPAPAAQVSYGTAINACARGRRWQTALALLGRMRHCREGPQPNAFVLSAAINACGGAGQWQEALRLLEAVQEVPPHPRVYNAALAACDKGGQPEAAVRLLRRMRAAGVELDVFSYSSAMSACCKPPRAADGRVDPGRGVAWRTALRLHRTMRGTGVRPNTYTYSSAMTACERGGCWEEALLLLGDMRADRVAPNRVVYTAAIGACGSQGQWVQVALRAPPAPTGHGGGSLAMPCVPLPWPCLTPRGRACRRSRSSARCVASTSSPTPSATRCDPPTHARAHARTHARTHLHLSQNTIGRHVKCSIDRQDLVATCVVLTRVR